MAGRYLITELLQIHMNKTVISEKCFIFIYHCVLERTLIKIAIHTFQLVLDLSGRALQVE